jgi:hypothetical protein
MRQTLGMIVSVSLLAAGCASLRQESRMYNGPFGRTEVGGIVIAADPGASKVLVETYDGDLWIYDVDSAIRGRLSTLRVGDEIILAFDDRIGGKRAMALNVVATGTRVVPPGLSVAAMLPLGVTFGAPATNPSGAIAVAGTSGIVLGSSGTMVVGPTGTPILAGPGVIVPGFVSFSQLPAGTVTPQTAGLLGIGSSAFIAGPTGVTSFATTGGTFLPGRQPITAGNFSPGTVSPGVTTANPSAPGQPVVQGPFTPGTVAPGVSVQQGNAPPPPAGLTTTGGVMMTPNSNRPGSDFRMNSAGTSTGTTGTSATTAQPGATTTQPAMTPPPGTTGTPGTTVTPGTTTSGTRSAPTSNTTAPPRSNN